MTGAARKLKIAPVGDPENPTGLLGLDSQNAHHDFGNDEGEEGTFSGTVVQALMLMNGNDINQAKIGRAHV